MTEKQVRSQGLSNQGWKRIDDLLARSNKEQIRLIMFKCIEKLPDDQVMVTYNLQSSHLRSETIQEVEDGN